MKKEIIEAIIEVVSDYGRKETVEVKELLKYVNWFFNDSDDRALAELQRTSN